MADLLQRLAKSLQFVFCRLFSPVRFAVLSFPFKTTMTKCKTSLYNFGVEVVMAHACWRLLT